MNLIHNVFKEIYPKKNMVKVQIYDTQDQMWQQRGESIFDANLRARETLDDLYQKAMLEYKEKSGFNEKIIKIREERKQKGLLPPPGRAWVDLPPEQLGLSTDEQKKFNEQYHDLGKDLELTILFGLSAMENKYSFDNHNEGDITFSISEEEYETIASMAQEIKKKLPEVNFWGARITPLFYTTREERPIVPDEISNDPESYLKKMKEEANLDKAFPSEVKEQVIETLKGFAYCKDKIRGLTEEECAEFERLYQSNTP